MPLDSDWVTGLQFRVAKTFIVESCHGEIAVKRSFKEAVYCFEYTLEKTSQAATGGVDTWLAIIRYPKDSLSKVSVKVNGASRHVEPQPLRDGGRCALVIKLPQLGVGEKATVQYEYEAPVEGIRENTWSVLRAAGMSTFLTSTVCECSRLTLRVSYDRRGTKLRTHPRSEHESSRTVKFERNQVPPSDLTHMQIYYETGLPKALATALDRFAWIVVGAIVAGALNEWFPQWFAHFRKMIGGE